MAGPGGREVGRLSIRVLPDTSNFATSLQRYLDRVERRAQVNVRVVPDMTGFTADLQAKLSAIRARVDIPVLPDTDRFADQLRSSLATNTQRLTVPVSPDTSRFTDELRAHLAGTSERVRVPVVPDTTGFRQQLRAQLATVLSSPTRIDVVPNTIGFASRLRSELARIDPEVRVRAVPDVSGFRTALRARLAGIEPPVPVRLVLRLAEIQRLRLQLANIQPPISIPVRIDPTGSSILALRERLAAIGSSGAGLGGTHSALVKLLLAATTAIPQLTSLTVSLAQIGPAAALGATGFLAMATAGATLAIGLQGVGKALGGDAEALAKLAPAARDFVTTIRGMGPEMKKLQLDVQQRLFRGLGDAVQSTAKVAMPVFRQALLDSSTALNSMGKGVLASIRSLAKGGALDQALKGATSGLQNLSKLPATIVQGLFQIGAAAAPAFNRLTERAGEGLDAVSERMTRAFESGRMTEIIDQAISKARQLIDSLTNVAGIIGNVFGPAAAAGGDFLSTLQRVTAEIEKVTATREMQRAFTSLFDTLAAISTTAVPLLGKALQGLAPVVTVLGPPIQRLVETLGRALTPIVDALAPVLETVAKGVRGILDAVSPLLEPIGRLVGVLVSGLGPVLQGISDQATQVAQALGGFLRPILDALPGVLEPIVGIIGKIIGAFVSFTAKVWDEVGPAFERIGQAIGRVIEALTPLLEKLGVLVDTFLSTLAPLLEPIIEAVGRLASMFADKLAFFLENVVIPAIEALVALLSGDFGKAWDKAKEVVRGFAEFLIKLFVQLPAQIDKLWAELKPRMGAAAAKALAALRAKFGEGITAATRQIGQLPGKAGAALVPLISALVAKAVAAGNSLISAIRSKINSAVGFVATLPRRAAGALSGLGGVLVGAGRQLVQGFINGIGSKVGELVSRARSMASSAISAAKNALGIRSPSRVFARIGLDTVRGFIKGIDGSESSLRKKITRLAEVLPKGVRAGLARSLSASTRTLDKMVISRGKVIDKLAAASKKLADLEKAWTSARGAIVSGIVSDADITKAILGAGGVSAIQSITNHLRNYSEQAKKFAANITRLKKLGLDADLLQQIATAGVEQGGRTAAALAAASKSQIAELNRAQTQLEKAAGTAGTATADALYRAGVNSAKGLVKGLESQQAAIEKQMLRIAKAMEKSIRRALGIRSPSRKLRWIGEMSVAGLVDGLSSGQPAVRREMRALSSELAGWRPSTALAGEIASLGASRPDSSPVVEVHTRDEALAGFIDVRVRDANGQLLSTLNVK